MTADYWTVNEVAQRAGVTPGAVRKAIYERRLAAIKRGRDWLIHPDEAKRWIDQREQGKKADSK